MLVFSNYTKNYASTICKSLFLHTKRLDYYVCNAGYEMLYPMFQSYLKFSAPSFIIPFKKCNLFSHLSLIWKVYLFLDSPRYHRKLTNLKSLLYNQEMENLNLYDLRNG